MTAGAVVSIQKPADAGSQQWVILSTGDSVKVSPADDPSLVLTVKDGGTQNGTLVVLKKDQDHPWQRWSLVKHENSSYSPLARHTTNQGLDHFGGRREIGAPIDLRSTKASNSQPELPIVRTNGCCQ